MRARALEQLRERFDAPLDVLAADRDQRLSADARALEAERGRLRQEQQVPAKRRPLEAPVASVAVEQHEPQRVVEAELVELLRRRSRERGIARRERALVICSGGLSWLSTMRSPR